MSSLEIPAGIMAERLGERPLLTFGMVCAGGGYLGVAHATGFTLIALAFFLTGIGAAFQHSLASSLLVQTFHGISRRRALGSYNACGDAGKLFFTASFSAALGAGFAWNTIVTLLAGAAIGFALAAWLLLSRVGAGAAPRTHGNRNGEPLAAPHTPSEHAADNSGQKRRGRGWGIKEPKRFALLGTLIFLDSTVQAVFLTFLTFVLLDKGVDEAIAAGGVVLALTGGMVGKLCCGFLAAKLGDRNTFILVQLTTLTAFGGVIALPAELLLLTLPVIGIFVQGSSTVTYGAVADFVTTDRQSRGYALIYTLSSAASVGGPFVFGLIADQWGLDGLLWTLIAVTMATIPPSIVLTTKANMAKSHQDQS